MKKNCFVLLFLSALILTAAEKPVLNLNAIMSKFNTPDGWYPNRQKAFAPLAKWQYLNENGKKVWHISESKGPEGCRFDNYSKHPVLAGDKLCLTAEVKGKGQGVFTIQAYSNQKWTGHIGVKKFAIPANWGKVKVIFDVKDLADAYPTTSAICMFGTTRGSDIYVRSITVERVAEIAGQANFPNVWTAFLPMDLKYQPTAAELTSVPKTLNGVKPRKVQFNGSEHDFKQEFGNRKGTLDQYGSGNCVWLYSVIEVPAAETYTIGAGADWWMQVNVNGKPVIDTLKNGNDLHPPRITDHKADVQLRKGKNILAVKFVTGAGSSMLALGGPNELRNLGQKLRMVEILCKEDYEKEGVKRSGNPQIRQGVYTFALINPTKQGTYSTKGTLDFHFGKTNFNMPKVASGKYFGCSFRLIDFSKPGIFRINFAVPGKKQNSQLEIANNGGNKLFFTFIDNGRRGKSSEYPLTLLPTDLLFTVNSFGDYKISLETLVDSSVKHFIGRSTFFANVNEQSFTVTASLRGKDARITLDDAAIGSARQEIAKKLIPMDIRVDKTFDPVKAGWKLVLSEDFKSGKFDTKKWYIHDPANADLIKVRNGMLELTMKTVPTGNGKVRYVGNGFSSRKNYGYGYYEATVRFRQQEGWVTAFWLYGGQTGNSFLDGMEVDIYEDYYVTKERPMLDCNFHGYVGCVQQSWNYTFNIPGPLENFYTIAVKWTPLEMTYYLNGKAIRTTANHSPHKTLTYDALNHKIGFAPLRLCFYGKPWSGEIMNLKKPFSDVYKVKSVRYYEYPMDKAPQIELVKDDKNIMIDYGKSFDMEAKITPNAKTKAPIKTVYLFDSGCLLDYKDKPPYKFTVKMDEKYFDATNYGRSGRSRQKPKVKGALHAFSIFAQDADGESAHSEVVLKMTRPPKKSTPYQGKAQVIPGRVDVNRYDEGGNGVAYMDDDVNSNKRYGFRPDEGVDTSGGCIGHVITGEWINLTVDVRKAGKYAVTMDYGAPAGYGGSMLMVLDENKIIGTFDLPNKGGVGWGGLKSTIRNVQLPAGRHAIKLVCIGAYNYFGMDFVPEK